MNIEKVIKQLDINTTYVIIYYHSHDDVRVTHLNPIKMINYKDRILAIIDGDLVWKEL
jgi:hypothetical protein